MAFDMASAKPIAQGFDISSARPIGERYSGAGGSSIANPPFLPKTQEVEEKIRGRKDSVQNLLQELKTPLPKTEEAGLMKYIFTPRKAMKVGVTGLKALAIPFQRGEAALASGALEAQKGSYLNIPQAIWKGISGQRQAELGDLIRTTGFGGGANELLASTTGFFGSLGISNLVTKGKIVSGVNKVENTLKSKLPQTMNKDYVLNKSKQLIDGIDTLEQGLFSNYDDIYKQIGDNPISTSINNADFWKELPSRAISKIKTVLKIDKKEEVIPATVNSLKSIRYALRKTLSKKAWIMPDAEEAKIITAYFKTGEIISQNAGEYASDLASLNAKAKDFYLLRKEIYNILLDSEGQPMANKLINLYKSGGERGKQVFFEKFAQLYPKAKDLTDDVVKFNKRQLLKATIGKYAPWIIGGTLAGRGVVRGITHLQQ